MPSFFIDRPVFAWVIAIFIVLAGVLTLSLLPVTRYPDIAPPSVSIRAIYPGASPEVISDSVISIIEPELSGVRNLLYFESSADTSGSATITATFESGTDPDLAQVDVQNKIKSIEPRLPEAVQRQGLTIESSSSGFLMVVALTSPDGTFNALDLGDYMSRTLVQPLNRVSGVGRVQSFVSKKAMRVWVDPHKLLSYSISLSDVTSAISAQNVQVSPGRVGAQPTLPGQRVSVPLRVSGQLSTVDEFDNIILRSDPDGSRVLLKDVARVEEGAQTYAFSSRINGANAAGAAIQLSPGANAMRTAEAIRERLEDLSTSFPEGMEYLIPYDTSPFVAISIEKVVQTLGEAMVLVFLVMLLFLQKIRYTLIPAIVAPIALAGTVMVMYVSGFSINVLTMFGMVLAIGIIVDDAIVVVENVERIMATEGLPPREATKKAMKQITGAVIGITLVLTAVFIPMGLASGAVGEIYRQFTMSMAVSILFSAFLALSLTPALCATLLKPVDVDHHANKRGFFGLFNRMLDRATDTYGTTVSFFARRILIMLVLYVAVVVGLGYSFVRLPTSFLPVEDQGAFITLFTLPSEATTERTKEVVQMYEQHATSREATENVVSVLGFSFGGSGTNTGLAFTTLKDWSIRETTAADEANAANKTMFMAPEGQIYSLLPPSIPSLGTSSGFAMRLQDRADHGYEALINARNMVLGMAAKSPLLTRVRPDGLPDGTSVRLNIDRQKAEFLGVPFSRIASTLSSAMGSTYVNDYSYDGQLRNVIVQADAAYRMQVQDVLKLNLPSKTGAMVELSEIVKPDWESSPLQLTRYNGFPAARISGSAAPGVSAGEAMAEMERIAEKLPQGFGIEWTGQSLQEQNTSAQTPLLLALSMFVVFLVLAALYESWTIPISVMLVIPLGVIGAVLAVHIRGMENDVFFKVGLITIIGLSAKNAILIVEFARALYDEGKSLHEAVLEAARLRLRPILMTSLAFTLGVTPLMLARGASAETQHAIGTGVFGGMISATFLAILFVPAFFVLVIKVSNWITGKKERPST
ncbi:multidrug efflux pump [Cohaesibacter sp. ES.047]|uniref:multidrug efflux RND transporter permease subunit n=1 Tax=Cohaesibacter sp. ES.047 TaxID=1798205 RepID=UPI000BB7F08A|nr:multidrug efflux RND transporter permease subunit [Cohaesibacter sp. ES.047]SNY92871.1 multidrug efflux pump [Cohaesibacter sp. ES.047]